MIHILALQPRRHRDGAARLQAPARNILPRLVRRDAYVGDRLQDHARHMQVRAVLQRIPHHGVHRHTSQSGDVPERDGLPQRPQAIASPRRPQRPVLVVRRLAFPRSQAGRYRRRGGAGRVMRVHERHEVRGDGGVVRLLQTGQREGARNEES